MTETTEERIQRLYRRDNPLAMSPLGFTTAEWYIMAELDKLAGRQRLTPPIIAESDAERHGE